MLSAVLFPFFSGDFCAVFFSKDLPKMYIFRKKGKNILGFPEKVLTNPSLFGIIISVPTEYCGIAKR